MVLSYEILTCCICSFIKILRHIALQALHTIGNNFKDISALQMQKLLQQETTVGAVLYHLEPKSMSLNHLESQTTIPHSLNLTDQQN